MNWYYAEGNEQKGPVSEAELDQLFQRGQLLGSTLVWKEGMANWEAYSSIRGSQASNAAAAGLAEGSVVCSQCNQLFSQNDVIRYGDKAVCAACKPVFLQKLKEGSALAAEELDYASFGIRFGAKFLDGIILRIVGTVVGFAVGAAFGAAGSADEGGVAIAVVVATAVEFIISMSYTIFFIGAYGATPGKMACKIRVVNPDGSKVSYAKATGRAFAEYLSAFTCMIGYIMAGFDSERRSLHDRICSTRVIRN
jgi:uncharacterized RDD family membrane protein YckC